MRGEHLVANHLQRLEAESIHIMREAIAGAENPVMLYSIGKDSAVMAHLAMRAFHPAKPPFPLLHVDTLWTFLDMYALRDRIADELGFRLVVHVNPEWRAQNINPIDHGSEVHTHIMKTEALKQALDTHGFDVAFGGARRDEERSRAKERIFSLRTAAHAWDPKRQRPELWQLYQGTVRPGEHLRAFPLSDWTELDIWQYIRRERIELPSIYYAHQREVIERDGMLLALSEWVSPQPGEEARKETVRFRTVGDATCTGAVRSNADTVEEIIREVSASRVSERGATRADDRFSETAMEDRKREGYF